MIKLDKEIKKSIFIYKQVKRTDSVAMYEQFYNGKIIAREVFIIPVIKSGVCIKMKGVVKKSYNEDTETLVNSSKFGITAWSFLGCDLIGAENKFKELTMKEKDIV